MPVEELKQIKFMASARYFAGVDGHIYTKKQNKFVKLTEYVDNQGYLRCCLTVNNKQYRKKVHSLILSTFSGARLKEFVCRHLDGNKTNNQLSNLA